MHKAARTRPAAAGHTCACTHESLAREAVYACGECEGVWCRLCMVVLAKSTKAARPSATTTTATAVIKAAKAAAAATTAGGAARATWAHPVRPAWNGRWRCPTPECTGLCELRLGDAGGFEFVPLKAPVVSRQRLQEVWAAVDEYWASCPQRAWALQVYTEWRQALRHKADYQNRLATLQQRVRTAKEVETLAWQTLFEAFEEQLGPDTARRTRLCHLPHCTGILTMLATLPIDPTAAEAPAPAAADAEPLDSSAAEAPTVAEAPVVMQCSADATHRACWACRESWEGPRHACQVDILESLKVIDAVTKPCPRCRMPTQKSSGCNQMFCSQCHAVWDWGTGRFDTGQIHNPDGLAWLEAHPTAMPARARNGGDLEAVSWIDSDLDEVVQWVFCMREDVLGGRTGRLSLAYGQRLIMALRCQRLRAEAAQGAPTADQERGSLAWRRSMYTLHRMVQWLERAVAVVVQLLSDVERILLRILPGVPEPPPGTDPADAGPLTPEKAVQLLRRRTPGSVWAKFHQAVLALPRAPGWPMVWGLTDADVVPWIREALGLNQAGRTMDRPQGLPDRLFFQLSWGTNTTRLRPSFFVDRAVGLFPVATPMLIGDTAVPNLQ